MIPDHQQMVKFVNFPPHCPDVIILVILLSILLPQTYKLCILHFLFMIVFPVIIIWSSIVRYSKFKALILSAVIADVIKPYGKSTVALKLRLKQLFDTVVPMLYPSLSQQFTPQTHAPPKVTQRASI